jgi:hypothetical protein
MNQKEREAHQTVSQPTSKSSLSAQVRMSNDAEVNPPDPVNSTPNSEDPSQSAGSSTSSTASSSLDSTSSAQAVPTELKPIDAWIEELVPGVETFLPSPATSDLSQAIARLEIERDLPRVELPLFDGTAIMWPRFVEQFYIQVHSRPGLTDSRRMDLLQSHLKGEAKRLIQGLGYSGRNYVQALKELKFVFGHRVSVARAYVNVLTNGGIIPSCDSLALRNFYVSVRDCVTTLRQMNYVSELSSGDVLQRTSKRIPNDKRVRWNDYVRKICHSREPGLPDLEAWLKDCVDSDFNPYAIEARPSKQYQQSSPFKNSHGYTAQQATLHNTSSQAPQMDLKKCPLCSEAHHISKCCKYTEKSAEDRYALVKANRLCFNCLYPSHQIAACTSNVVCKVPGCKSKHHTSLHRQRPSSARGATHDAQVNVLQGKRSTIYFQVLAVIAQGHNGRCISTYALLDSASDITLINSDLAHDLGLRGQTKTLTVNTMTSSSTVNSSCVSVSVRESNNPNACPIWIQEAWTKKGCFNCSPVRTSDIQHLEYVSDLHLIDIDPSDIKILIGANVPKAHLQLNVREGSVNEPVAIQTHLGWCLMGPSSLEVRDSRQAHVNNLISFEEQLNTQVEKFWKTESFGVTASICKPISVQDRKALVTLESETRFVNGHYEVPMLWKKVEKLPDDRGMAERRFQSLQKRLSSNIELKGKYSDVLNGYIAKGHARKLTNAEIKNVTDKTWYLPHHSVLNPKKPEKVRVVFDAAATFQDVSLNSRLVTGPDLLNSIFGVLQRF